MQPVVIFRCDASPAIGGGHIMRCLGLAEALAELGWRVTFASRPSTFATLPSLTRTGYTLRHLTAEGDAEVGELQRLAPGGCDLLVVDNYEWEASREARCRDWAERILVLDDGTKRNHDCDVLLDSAVLDRSSYLAYVPSSAVILTGPRHALLRRDFVEHRASARLRRRGREVRSILVSFGATDPFNATAIALDALAQTGTEAIVTVAMSSRAPHLESLSHHASRRVRFALDVGDMASLIESADMAIGAAGGMSFERAVLGLPTIMLQLAPNQRNLMELFVKAGAAVDAGVLDSGTPARLSGAIARLISDAELRDAIGEAASALVDGKGPRRITAVLAGGVVLDGGGCTTLTLAESEDREVVLSWQLEPGARRYSRNPRMPTTEEHALWYAATLEDPSRRLFVIRVDGEPVGNLRLDRLTNSPDRYEVSIIVCHAARGRGVALAALQLARRVAPNAILDAVISPRNTASLRVFRNADYQHVADDLYRSLPI